MQQAERPRGFSDPQFEDNEANRVSRLINEKCGLARRGLSLPLSILGTYVDGILIVSIHYIGSLASRSTPSVCLTSSPRPNDNLIFCLFVVIHHRASLIPTQRRFSVMGRRRMLQGHASVIGNLRHSRPVPRLDGTMPPDAPIYVQPIFDEISIRFCGTLSEALGILDRHYGCSSASMLRSRRG